MKSYCILIPYLFIIACNQLTPEEQAIKETLGQTVNIDYFTTIQQGDRTLPYAEFRENYRYLSIVYLEDGCMPCYPKFIEWQERMSPLAGVDNYTVLFIIRGSDFSTFMENLLESEPQYDSWENNFHVVMDPDWKYLDNNMDVPRWIQDKSLLIDADNEIKLIGPPFASNEMTELFRKITKQNQ